MTKSEAAERLSVSVRTVERLVATGRLPQVHVARLARFRVKDLEAYVDGLHEPQAGAMQNKGDPTRRENGDDHAGSGCPESGSDHGRRDSPQEYHR